ncbi:hypothetical protein KPG66_06885 [Mycetohabitans sp. B2]|nr:hypothetical protein [Mycetohabitans sp. B2]MCF7695847.1 hypothetical protein [Mycetohabitans sp. B2]
MGEGLSMPLLRPVDSVRNVMSGAALNFALDAASVVPPAVLIGVLA